MPPVPQSRFDRALAGLDRRTLTAFVAALWRARGRSVRLEAGLVIVTGDREAAGRGEAGTGVRERERRIHVRPASRLPGVRRRLRRAPVPDSADAVVVADGGPVPAGVDRITPEDLRRMALYAVDRADRDRLFETHLGIDPVVPERSSPGSGSGLSAAGGTRQAGGSLGVAVALVVMLSAAAFMLAPAGDAETTAGPATPTVPDREAFDAASVDVTPEPTTTVSPDRIAPGFNRSGIVDPAALASAHADLVDEWSYTMAIRYEEYHDGRLIASGTETARVAEPGVYRSDLETTGSFWTAGGPIYRAETYANGTYRWERTGITTRRTYYRTTVGDRSQGWYAARAGALLTRYLDVERSERVGPVHLHSGWYSFVRGEGHSFAGYRNYTLAAVISPHGFVREVDVQYERPRSNVTVKATIVYRQRGDTDVDPPEWLPWAKRAIAQRTD